MLDSNQICEALATNIISFSWSMLIAKWIKLGMALCRPTSIWAQCYFPINVRRCQWQAALPEQQHRHTCSVTKSISPAKAPLPIRDDISMIVVIIMIVMIIMISIIVMMIIICSIFVHTLSLLTPSINVQPALETWLASRVPNQVENLSQTLKTNLACLGPNICMPCCKTYAKRVGFE